MTTTNNSHFYRDLLIRRWETVWSHLPSRTVPRPTIHRAGESAGGGHV